MTAIASDKEFKATLASLSVARQREVGARFVANVLDHFRFNSLLP